MIVAGQTDYCMVAVFVCIVAIAFLVYALLDASVFELHWVYPFALLALGYRNETLQAWSKYANVNTFIIYNPTPVPEIQSKGLGCEYLPLFKIFIYNLIYRFQF